MEKLKIDNEKNYYVGLRERRNMSTPLMSLDGATHWNKNYYVLHCFKSDLFLFMFKKIKRILF